MPIVNLDSAFCAGAECRRGKKKTDYWDKELKGFVLETRPSGGKTFYLRYVEENGRQRQINGRRVLREQRPYPCVSIRSARDGRKGVVAAGGARKVETDTAWSATANPNAGWSIVDGAPTGTFSPAHGDARCS